MKILCNGYSLARDAKMCDSFFSRVKGLMFLRLLKKGEGLVLKADREGIMETSIHMFFVFFGIDAVWINDKMEVTDIKRNIRPFTPLIRPRKAARYVVEMPAGSVKNVKIGDKINFLK